MPDADRLVTVSESRHSGIAWCAFPDPAVIQSA
jgi:hypothetical protein